MELVNNWLERTDLLLGNDKISALKNAHIFVVGLGGVGGYTAEMLCRAGVGKLSIADGDVVSRSNLNRQLCALNSTVGMHKTAVLERRLKDINPNIELQIYQEFLNEARFLEILNQNFTYVVDAIDTLSPKYKLICACLERKMPIVSAMGAGGKLDPTKIQISDISKSYNCKLAFRIRKRLYKKGFRTGFKVVFSPEEVDCDAMIFSEEEIEPNKKTTVGTISYMPAIFGCYCASVVVNEIISSVKSKDGNLD